MHLLESLIVSPLFLLVQQLRCISYSVWWPKYTVYMLLCIISWVSSWWSTDPVYNPFQQLWNASTRIWKSLFGSLLVEVAKAAASKLPSQQWGFGICQSDLFQSRCKKSKNLNLECIKGSKKQLPSEQQWGFGICQKHKVSTFDSSTIPAFFSCRVVWIKWLLGSDFWLHLTFANQWEKH